MPSIRVTVKGHTRVMPIKTFAIVCRWCGQTATVEAYPGRTPTLCSKKCAIEARKDHDRRRKAGKTTVPPAPRAAVVAPMALPSRFVLWPSEVDRTLDRSLNGVLGTGLMGTMKTRADGRRILTMLDALLVESWAVTVRWVVLECIRREPAALAERLAVTLTPDPLRKEVQWQREVTTLRSQLTGQGRMSHVVRNQVWAVMRPIWSAMVGGQMDGLGAEEALTVAERAVAERELAAALVQLEGVLRRDSVEALDG